MLAGVLFPVNARTLQPTEINNDLRVALHNRLNGVALQPDRPISAVTSAPELRPT